MLLISLYLQLEVIIVMVWGDFALWSHVMCGVFMYSVYIARFLSTNCDIAMYSIVVVLILQVKYLLFLKCFMFFSVCVQFAFLQ